MPNSSVIKNSPQRLVRSLTLTHAVLYGLGVTIGAGIYVLVGIAAGRSGMHAPLAFVGAAMVTPARHAAFSPVEKSGDFAQNQVFSARVGKVGCQKRRRTARV